MKSFVIILIDLIFRKFSFEWFYSKILAYEKKLEGVLLNEFLF